MRPPTEPPHAPRLLVEEIDHRRGADGSGEVSVRLALRGRSWTGRSQGLLTREGGLRMGAHATLEAVSASTGERLTPDLVGIKAIRAFDSWLVIVSIEVDDGDRQLRLLGAEAAADGDLVRGAVLAVLDALNRILERVLA